MPTAGPVTEPRIDPTGQRVAYVTDGALHVVELGANVDRALATPEQAEVTYGLPEHVAAESMYRYQGFWWAPDGRQLLVARVDNSPVQRWWIADPADPQKAPRAIRYPAAGTANADVTLHVLRLDGTRTEINWDRRAFEYLTTASWDAHGPLLSVQSRDHRTLLILAADPATGQTRLLHEERDPAWVELTYGAAPLRTRPAAWRTSPTWAATGDWSSTENRSPPTASRSARSAAPTARRSTSSASRNRPRNTSGATTRSRACTGSAIRPGCTAARRRAAPWSGRRGPRRARR